MNFKMDSFHCAECGSELLIDVISRTDVNGRELIKPEKILCLNAEEDYEPVGFKATGRQQLITEILKLRQENLVLRREKKNHNKRGLLSKIGEWIK